MADEAMTTVLTLGLVGVGISGTPPARKGVAGTRNPFIRIHTKGFLRSSFKSGLACARRATLFLLLFLLPGFAYFFVSGVRGTQSCSGGSAGSGQ
jgi:hypothetical protein